MIFKRAYTSPYLNFFKRVIELSPEKSIIEITSNFDENEYTQNELNDIRSIRKLKECSTERQRVVLKLIAVEQFRIREESKQSYLTLKIENESRKELINTIDLFFDDSDICHCNIRIGEKLILESYDGFFHNGISNEINLTRKEISEFEKTGMDFSTIK